VSRDPAKEKDRVRIRIDLNAKEAEYVRQLLATGLYGLNMAQVCHRLVDDGIARLRKHELSHRPVYPTR
jgi:hypothetical protein